MQPHSNHTSISCLSIITWNKKDIIIDIKNSLESKIALTNFFNMLHKFEFAWLVDSLYILVYLNTEINEPSDLTNNRRGV